MIRRIGLVGCVKEKSPFPQPARDLYTSTLFRGRRSFVETSCSEWWILSALHGLVDPSDVVAPYDLALKGLGRADRRRWSQQVLRSIDELVKVQPGDVVEFHAGAEYREFGLETGLMNRGCQIENPTLGMGIGIQLRFYKEAQQLG
jgi:hypothetical protein